MNEASSFKLKIEVVISFFLGTFFGLFFALVLVGRYQFWAVHLKSKTLRLPRFSSTQPLVWSRFTKQKIVALTFDDGPDPRFTPRILDILKKENIKATFFVVGKNAAAYPNLIRREYQDGHLIANHTWDHPELPLMNKSAIKRELDATFREIKLLTGHGTYYFRPPRGMLNGDVFWIANRSNYRVVLWSSELHEIRFDPRDDAKVVAANVEPGDIILAHDGGQDHTKGVQALPYLIKLLKQRGYHFVRVDQLLLPKTKIANYRQHRRRFQLQSKLVD